MLQTKKHISIPSSFAVSTFELVFESFKESEGVSLCFPIKFLKGFQCVPQNVPNSITLLSYMFYLKLSSFDMHRWAFPK